MGLPIPDVPGSCQARRLRNSGVYRRARKIGSCQPLHLNLKARPDDPKMETETGVSGTETLPPSVKRSGGWLQYVAGRSIVTWLLRIDEDCGSRGIIANPMVQEDLVARFRTETPAHTNIPHAYAHEPWSVWGGGVAQDCHTDLCKHACMHVCPRAHEARSVWWGFGHKSSLDSFRTLRFKFLESGREDSQSKGAKRRHCHMMSSSIPCLAMLRTITWEPNVFLWQVCSSVCCLRPGLEKRLGFESLEHQQNVVSSRLSFARTLPDAHEARSVWGGFGHTSSPSLDSSRTSRFKFLESGRGGFSKAKVLRDGTVT